MTVEFYHRHGKRLIDRNVQAIVADDLAKCGYVVDRLREVEAERYGTAYWKYLVPVRQVVS